MRTPVNLKIPAASTARALAGLLFLQAATIGLAQNPAATVSVDAAASRRPINPNIYGQNWASASEVSTLNAPINRFGGNANSRYNWQIDAHSAGADWFFETYSDGDGTPGASVDNSIAATRSAGNGAEPLITIPMLDYLAKLGPNRSTLAGFSVKKYGAQKKSDPWNSDAGNGIGAATGNNITGNDPLDTGVANSAAIQKAWVQHFVSQYGTAGTPNGIKYYILDNEPSIWSGTHRDVHPNRPGYDEMYNKVVAYASAIRSADPAARIIGIEEWDWWAMYSSGVDQGGGNDYGTHGNMRYYPWLLQKLFTYKQQTGVQLIDILSVHGYTDMPDFTSSGGDDSLTAQLVRNRHTRILWDPNYKSPYWWKDININGSVINWIPTLRAWVAQYYPGLQIAFTEYAWGDEPYLNGATTQADVLGIYGREGLDMANRWGVGKDSNGNSTVTYLASQIYRNYDGNRSGFGDTSVAASVANPDNLSAFASVRSSDGALTVMVINKQQGSTPVTVNLANFQRTASAQVWQINSTAQTSIAHLADVSISNGALTTTLPSQSITLFVLHAAPVVTTPPLAQNAMVGGSVTFTAAASGLPVPTFQWQKNGVDIGGATSATLTLTNLHRADAGNFTVKVTNAYGTASSIAATLVITVPNPLGDFDHDHRADALWHNTSTGLVASWVSGGGFTVFGLEGGGWSVIGTGDFDGDGKAEALWRNSSTGLVAAWTSSGGFTTFGVEGDGGSVLGVGDFDGDGKTDVLWHYTTSGLVASWTSTNGYTVLGTEGGGWQVIGTGDFNGDGKADLLWSNLYTGVVAAGLTNGSYVSLDTEGGGWEIVGTGDFNGDGSTDLLWHNTSTGVVSGELISGGYLSLGTEGGGWSVIGSGDFDGDGVCDVLWRNPGTGLIASWTSGGGFTVFGVEGGGWSVFAN